MAQTHIITIADLKVDTSISVLNKIVGRKNLEIFPDHEDHFETPGDIQDIIKLIGVYKKNPGQGVLKEAKAIRKIITYAAKLPGSATDHITSLDLFIELWQSTYPNLYKTYMVWAHEGQGVSK